MQHILDQSLWQPMRTSRKDKRYIQKVPVAQLKHHRVNLCRLDHQRAVQSTQEKGSVIFKNSVSSVPCHFLYLDNNMLPVQLKYVVESRT